MPDPTRERQSGRVLQQVRLSRMDPMTSRNPLRLMLLSRRTRLSRMLLILGAFLLSGYTLTASNTIVWQYFGTPDGTGAYFEPTTGRPTTTQFTATMPAAAALPPLPGGLISRVLTLLPEGRNIRNNSQGLLLDTDDKSNLEFSATADVWVTFLSETAGFRNSVGFFDFDANSPPTSPAGVTERIIFPNASMPSALTAAGSDGNTVYLGQFAAGRGLGIVLAANGFSATGRSSGATQVPGVKESIDRNWIFYSLRKLNPEPNDGRNLNVHTVMLRDQEDSTPGYQRIIVGMEDINREIGGDHDFNDVILVLHVKTRSAIANLTNLPILPGTTSVDTDGDGVKDELDEFPADPNRAFTRSYPDSNSWGTLAFEDDWPIRGDYDLNDLVMRYRITETLNAARQVTSLAMTYRLDARGALYSSGFAVHLQGVNASAISSATIAVDGAAATALTPESGMTEAVVHVFTNGVVEAPDGGCLFFNTNSGCPQLPRRTYVLNVDFTTPQPGLAPPPYNPFIYRTATRGHETHLAGKPPTSKALATMFRTGDDRTYPGTNYTYMDANRLPWAMDLPIEWKYPEERNALVSAYPDLAVWASSSGALNRNWYLTNVVISKLYRFGAI